MVIGKERGCYLWLWPSSTACGQRYSPAGSYSKESVISPCKYLEALFSGMSFPVHPFSPRETTDLVKCSGHQVQRKVSFKGCFKNW